MQRIVTLLGILVTASTTFAIDAATFGEYRPVPGDAIEQTVRLEMRLETTARQGAEVLEESSTSVERQQQRVVTATDVREGRVVSADVTFVTSSANREGVASVEPVAGKSYHCTREGEQLKVVTPEGVLPPMKEYALVARAMESLGTESPLAKFLAGRTVRVGEQLTLPAEVAQKSLGFDSKVGIVEAFQLTLESIELVENRRVARFSAQIEAVGGGTQQMRLIIEGAFQVDEATCRVVSADLSGPIALSGLRGTGASGYQLDGRGRMQLALTARYRDATR